MFKAIALTGDQYLVEGEDTRGTVGSTVVDGTQWNQLKAARDREAAAERFDDAITDFYADLVTAANELQQAQRVHIDPLEYIVEQESSPGAEAAEQILTRLTPGSVVLRAIETGASDRLLWVHDELVLTAAEAATVSGSVTPGNEEDDNDGSVGEIPVF